MERLKIDNNGFTLIEIVVSLIILATIATGLFAGFVVVKRFTYQVEYRLQATNYCRATLEYLSIKNYDDNELKPGEYEHLLPESDFKNKLMATRIYNVEDIDWGSNPPDAKKIKVFVNYTDLNSRKQEQQTLLTLRARK